jgi:hypothetical protein
MITLEELDAPMAAGLSPFAEQKQMVQHFLILK